MLMMVLLLMMLLMLMLMTRLMLMMKKVISRISEVLLEVESRIIEVSVLPHRRHCCTSKSSSSSSSYLKMIPRLFPDLIKSSKARGVPEKILCCGENEKGSCGGRNQLAGSPELYTKHRSSSRSIAV